MGCDTAGGTVFPAWLRACSGEQPVAGVRAASNTEKNDMCRLPVFRVRFIAIFFFLPFFETFFEGIERPPQRLHRRGKAASKEDENDNCQNDQFRKSKTEHEGELSIVKFRSRAGWRQPFEAAMRQGWTLTVTPLVPSLLAFLHRITLMEEQEMARCRVTTRS